MLKPIAFAVALLALLPANAWAASGNAKTLQGSVGAAIVAPLVLTHVSGAKINFGTFIVNSGGTVVVSPTGAGSVTGTVVFAPGSTNAADAFTVTGDASRAFAITTIASSVTSSGGNIVFVSTPSATVATTDATGHGTFTVGGTLLVGSNVVPGVYNGTYTATIVYN